VIRKGVYCPDDELFVDMALASSHPVDLTYRYSHSLC